MTDETQVPSIEVDLADEDYWGSHDKALGSVFEQMSAARVQGVWLAAPSSVALDTRETLPVIAYRGGSHADVRALSFDAHAVLVAVDLERNRVVVGKAVIDLMGPPPPPSTRPPPKGYLVSPQVIDARERLGLAWLPTRLLFTLLMRDRVSNRVEVVMGKSARSYEDPEVARYIARERARLAPLEIVPGERDPVPSYGEQPRSPALPSTPGVALALERVVPLGPSARCVVWGSFRLASLAEERLEPDSRPPLGLLRPDVSVSVERERPAAIVRISLVLLAAETGSVLVLPLRVPSWSLGEDGCEVVGYFTLDLFAELPEMLSKPAQTWFLYAFSGEHLTEPKPVGLLPLGLI